MENTQQKVRPAHCLVFPYPMQGHINPMLQFSKRLEQKGVKVTLVTTKSTIKCFHRISDSMALETISDGYDEGRIDAITDAYLATFKQVGSKTLSVLIENLNTKGCPVDCIVYDSGFPWCMDVAKRFGLVGAAFFTQSCAVDNIYYNVHQGLLELPLVGTQVLIPGLPVLEPSDFPTFLNEKNSALYNLVLSQFLDIEKVDWLLCNTFDKLEEEAISWMSTVLPIKAIGPTIPMKYLQAEKIIIQDEADNTLHLFKPNDACMDWLNERDNESVVYVSFGSLAQLNDEQMHELAWGLKQSNKYFLWVVRPSEESKIPKGFVEETLDKGLIVQWCSQLDVLAHEAVGCFVTHCGWNSSLESISLGVPMVAVPRWSDQPTNAKYVADVWKMGVKAMADEKGMITREVVDACIREVMNGENGKELRNNAKRWMVMAREAVKEGGTSDKWIDEFVANIFQHSKSVKF